MQQLTLNLLRRSRHSPPPPLHYFFSHYTSSSSSHSSFTTSLHRHHHHNRRHNDCYNPRCASTLSSPYSHNLMSSNRRFSSFPDFSGSGDPILPVRALISLLDSFHDFTGLPWWLVISLSTVCMRLAIAPLTIVQLKKVKRIGEMMPKLPPPFPPPLSGRSFRDQISLFLKEKKAAGGPSIFWFFASFAVQAPCFLLWIMSIRTMSMNNHPSFDSGGMLWFENLTEYPNGVWGPIFPLVIAGLYFTNIEMSFRSSLQQLPGTLGFLAKLFKMYLQLLTLPILYTAFNLPQGSLVYWLTNSLLSLTQTICLSNPSVLEYLGLPKRNVPSPALPSERRGTLGAPDIILRTKQGHISAQNLSPTELVNYSIKASTDGHLDIATNCLRLVLEKDPGHVRALIIMGQTLLKKAQLADAAECLESAVSKLLLSGHPSEPEEVDLLILSSLWAGVANRRQGNLEKGVQHLDRIARLDEPEDSKIKAHYYDGLVMLSSALLALDRKDESLKYLQKAAAYNPAYKVYIKQLETELEDFSCDLASSRREI